MGDKPLIDWFTVVAQVVNFLILVAVLKYFLYGRILAAMDERQQKITAQLDDAEKARQQAETELQEYRGKLHEIEEKRMALLTKAGEEAEREKKELLHRSRQEIDEQKRRWYEALRQESTGLLRDLRGKLSHGVCNIARKTLADLADAELEERMATVFLHRLRQLGAEEHEKIRQSLRGAENRLVVHSSFALSPERQNSITQALRESFPEIHDVRFETSKTSLCGFRLSADGYQLDWEMNRYLAELEQKMQQELNRQTTAFRQQRDDVRAAHGVSGQEPRTE